VYRHVQQKGVDAAVPRDVDETDELLAAIAAHVRQAEGEDRREVALAVVRP
jgi:hypothetical protein